MNSTATRATRPNSNSAKATNFVPSSPTPNAGVVSIHSRAMLVSLSVSAWTARKFDRKVTDEIHQAHHAKSDVGRYNKHLLGGKDSAASHAAVMTAAGALRSGYYAQTLPWSDEGWRLLPSANFMAFSEKMRELRAAFDTAVEAFLLDYPTLREAARQRLSGMYREEEYPNALDIRCRFSATVEFSPVPSKDDFRLTLPAEHAEEIERGVTDRVSRATAVAMEDAWNRLRVSVDAVRERLSDPKNVFRDSLITNVRDVVDVLTRMNVTNDPTLEAMRVQVASEIASLDPQHLRTSTRTRKEAAEKAQSILDRMQTAYGGVA